MAEARRLVRAAVRSWGVPVDAEIVVLLTSELVTNAVTHGTACAEPVEIATVTVLITGSRDAGLRVDVHDSSPVPPVAGDLPLDSGEHGRGLLLVETLASKWGSYRTGLGKSVYFTLGAADENAASDLE